MRKLGKTNLEVFELGCGGIPVQRTPIEEVKKMIEAMIDCNMNFIDSARGYSNSEELFGEALVGKREKFIIATKSMSRNYEGMKRDIEISLKNFKTNYIDIYQLHNVSENDDYTGAYKALVEAKKQGKIKHIGITTHSLSVLKRTVDENVFETIQFPYNIIETQGEEIFKIANKKDIGIIIMKPLGGGAIDCVESALKFLMRNKDISVIIPGMESVSQIYDNYSYIHKEETFQDKVNEKEIINDLKNDFCRRCGYCMPCKKGINIPFSFLCEGYYKRYNLKEWAISRYNSMPIKPSVCVECGECEFKCPYHLPIRKKLKEVVKIMEEKYEEK